MVPALNSELLPKEREVDLEEVKSKSVTGRFSSVL